MNPVLLKPARVAQDRALGLGLSVAPGSSYQASVDAALDEMAARLEEHLDVEAMLG